MWGQDLSAGLVTEITFLLVLSKRALIFCICACSFGGA